MTGLTAKAIRYYERISLIAPAHRLENSYREYNRAHIRELSFVSHARELGFTLKECAELLDLYRDQGRKSRDVKCLALQKIVDVEQKIEQLTAIRDSLKALSNDCDGNDLSDCPILDRLSLGSFDTRTQSQ